jgi:hypothetical protein
VIDIGNCEGSLAFVVLNKKEKVARAGLGRQGIPTQCVRDEFGGKHPSMPFCIGFLVCDLPHIVPIGRIITCPERSFIPCSIGSKLCCKNKSFDAYLLLWSHLGTITCPLVHPGNSEGQVMKNAALF